MGIVAKIGDFSCGGIDRTGTRVRGEELQPKTRKKKWGTASFIGILTAGAELRGKGDYLFRFS